VHKGALAVPPLRENQHADCKCELYDPSILQLRMAICFQQAHAASCSSHHPHQHVHSSLLAPALHLFNFNLNLTQNLDGDPTHAHILSAVLHRLALPRGGLEGYQAWGGKYGCPCVIGNQCKLHLLGKFVNYLPGTATQIFMPGSQRAYEVTTSGSSSQHRQTFFSQNSILTRDSLLKANIWPS